MTANAPIIANPEVAADAVANVGRAMDFSLWGLFVHVDLLGKFIILTLLAGSVASWAIIYTKYRMVTRLKLMGNRFEDAFWSGESLDKLYDRMSSKITDPMTAIFCAGMKEWRRAIKNRFRSRDSEMRANVVRRIDRAMDVTISREMGAAERYMTFLASTGSVAPFVGLLGTVWGIMNSFIAIAGSNNTALSVVAPGIAEALYTTALSLIVAIPAVLAYNKFNSDLGKYNDRLDAFASEFSAILTRHMEDSATEPTNNQQAA
jgi:biopolymer transport protein TolQ